MVARIMPRGLGFFFVPLIFSSLSQKGKKKSILILLRHACRKKQTFTVSLLDEAKQKLFAKLGRAGKRYRKRYCSFNDYTVLPLSLAVAWRFCGRRRRRQPAFMWLCAAPSLPPSPHLQKNPFFTPSI